MYDMMASLIEFLHIYSTVVRAAIGIEDVMAIYFHISLKNSTSSWFMNLPQGSVRS
jgi:hypothetical protein